MDSDILSHHCTLNNWWSLHIMVNSGYFPVYIMSSMTSDTFDDSVIPWSCPLLIAGSYRGRIYSFIFDYSKGVSRTMRSLYFQGIIGMLSLQLGLCRCTHFKSKPFRGRHTQQFAVGAYQIQPPESETTVRSILNYTSYTIGVYRWLLRSLYPECVQE